MLKPIPQTLVRKRLEAVSDIFDRRSREVIGQGKMISLAEGGCLLPPSISVQLALKQALATPTSNPFQIYPMQNAHPDFLEAVTEYFETNCHIPVREKKMGLTIGIGSGQIYDGFLSALCHKEDVIITPTSYYHGYISWTHKWEAITEDIQTSAENGFKLQASELEAWLSHPNNRYKKTKALLLTNPTSVGAIYTQKELEELANVIKKYGIYVFSDEVYLDTEFSPQEKTISLASLEGMHDYVVTATSGSKNRGVADLRLGWACGPNHLMDRIISYIDTTITNIPTYLQKVGIEIINTPKEYLDKAKQEYLTRFHLLQNQIQRINHRLNSHYGTQNIAYFDIPYAPQAGHYLCLNLNALKGFQTKDGQTLQNGSDLAHFFFDPFRNGNPSQGVTFSAGYSKGHEDLILYIAFAQLGFEAVTEALQPYTNLRLFQQTLQNAAGPTEDISLAETRQKAALINLPYAHATEPDLEQAYQVGRNILIEAFDRLETALIENLCPPDILTSPVYVTWHEKKQHVG